MKIVLILLLVFIVGCSGDDEVSVYHVSCTIGGTYYSYVHGINGSSYGDDRSVGYYSLTEYVTYIYGMKSSYDFGSGDPGANLIVVCPGSTLGTYSDGESAGLYFDAPNGDEYYPVDFILNLTNYGDIGEPISGTFFGTITNVTAGGPLQTVTDGSFNVIRISNGSLD